MRCHMVSKTKKIGVATFCNVDAELMFLHALWHGFNVLACTVTWFQLFVLVRCSVWYERYHCCVFSVWPWNMLCCFRCWITVVIWVLLNHQIAYRLAVAADISCYSHDFMPVRDTMEWRWTAVGSVMATSMSFSVLHGQTVTCDEWCSAVICDVIYLLM